MGHPNVPTHTRTNLCATQCKRRGVSSFPMVQASDTQVLDLSPTGLGDSKRHETTR